MKGAARGLITVLTILMAVLALPPWLARGAEAALDLSLIHI